MGGNINKYDPSDVQAAIAALAAYPTLQQASEYMKSHSGKLTGTRGLEEVRRKHAHEIADAKSRLTPAQEHSLSDNLLDNATLSAQVTNLALESIRKKLEHDEVQDPDRVARNLADVAAKSIDKKLSLEGRPSRIVDNRSAAEILRALEGMQVVKYVDAEAT